MKVLLVSPFSQLSGYGRDGIGLALALLDRGHDVRISPTHIGVPLPQEIAGLLTLPVDGPFDLAIHHVEPNKAHLVPSDAAMARVNVLWTMWGWDTLPAEPWVADFTENTTLFDYVVAYDPDSAHAFAAHIDADRLKIVLGGYAAEDWKRERDPARDQGPRRYTFGMNGRLTVRKGVYIAYQAFIDLCEEHGDAFDATFALRSTEPVFPPSFPVHPRVRVLLSRSLPPDLRRFYSNIDTLVAPSYAEAKHLPPIEALTCGTPVIVSDIPGHRTWATSDIATLVPGTREAVEFGYVGTRVSEEDLAAAMWDHYTDRPAARMRTERAQRMLPSMLDWGTCCERLGLNVGVRI